MMISLVCGYLVIGFIFSVTLYFIYYDPKSKFNKDIEEVFYGKRSWNYKLREAFVVPLTILAIGVLWPLALWMVSGNELTKKKNSLKKSDGKLFLVKKNYLIEYLKINEIEKNETYHDPLNLVPSLPFGYFNLAWQDFKTLILNGDQLWSFIIPKGEIVGEYEMETGEDIVGYAIVREGIIVGEFIAEGSGAY